MTPKSRRSSPLPRSVPSHDAPAWAIAMNNNLNDVMNTNFAVMNNNMKNNFAVVHNNMLCLAARIFNQSAAATNRINRQAVPVAPVVLKVVETAGGPFAVNTRPHLVGVYAVRQARLDTALTLNSALTGPDLNVLFQVYQDARFSAVHALARRRVGFRDFMLE
jgi:hypothetical protein